VRHIYDDYYGCNCQGGGVKEGKKTNSLWLFLDDWYDVTEGYNNLPAEWKAILEADEKEVASLEAPMGELAIYKKLDEKIRKEADKIESKYRTYHGWEIDFTEGKVIIDWTESWSYGGQMRGTEEIPLSSVLDPSPVKEATLSEEPAPKSTKKKWYLFHKSFQGGTHDEWRLLDHKPKDEDMENWGEHTGGGHNYGYRVTVKKGTPPREVIVKKIEEVRKHIERINKSRELEDCQEEIAELESFLGTEGDK
jgi:hypothetical protein